MPLPRWLVANSSSLLYTLLLGLLPLFFSSTVTYYAIRYESHIRNFDTLAWVGFYTLSSLTMAFALTPTTFIALLSGYFLGWSSILPVSVSYLAASWIGYRAAQRLDGGHFMRNFPRKERAEKMVSSLKNNEFGLIVMARLSPVLPFAVTNVVLSLSGASVRAFLTAGFIGMLPRTMLSIWVGSQARQIKTLLETGGGNYSLQAGLGILVLVSLAGLSYYIRKAVIMTNGK